MDIKVHTLLYIKNAVQIPPNFASNESFWLHFKKTYLKIK